MSSDLGWIIPNWQAPSGVRAVFTTRQGPVAGQGVSAKPWDRFNLGDHVNDDPAAVAVNRRLLQGAIAAHPVFLTQVHGTKVVELDASTPDGAEADGAVTLQAGIACTMMVADCLPVLLTNGAGTVVGAAHAGWRGLASGVLERTVGRLRDLARIKRSTVAERHSHGNEVIMAWLGPCIGPHAFEVGAELREAFLSGDTGAAMHFESVGAGKYLADLPALARRRLAAVGVEQLYGNDGAHEWCTVTNPQRFFSYRRDQPVWGASGRMAACIWRV